MTGRQTGFTYIAVLIWIAILATGLAAVAQVTATVMRRDRERELLHIGAQFRRALNGYYASHRRYPMRIDDLVLDNHSAGVRRHLRKIFTDPMTRRAEWGTVRLRDGQIVGVHSLSQQAPLKKAGFLAADADFEGKDKYSEWVFMSTARAPAAAPPASAPPKPTLREPAVPKWGHGFAGTPR